MALSNPQAPTATSTKVDILKVHHQNVVGTAKPRPRAKTASICIAEEDRAGPIWRPSALVRFEGAPRASALQGLLGSRSRSSRRTVPEGAFMRRCAASP